VLRLYSTYGRYIYMCVCVCVSTEYWQHDTNRQNLKYVTKNLPPPCHFVLHKSQVDCPGIKTRSPQQDTMVHPAFLLPLTHDTWPAHLFLHNLLPYEYLVTRTNYTTPPYAILCSLPLLPISVDKIYSPACCYKTSSIYVTPSKLQICIFKYWQFFYNRWSAKPINQ